MRKKLVLFPLSIILAILSCLTVFAEDTNSLSNVFKNDSGYKITDYNVNIKVDIDNVYYVTENVDVYFNETSHSLFKIIPLSSHIKQENGNTKPAEAVVKILQCSDNYSISRKNDNLLVRIGDVKKTLIGKKSYSITYAYYYKKDVFDNSDIFFFNVIGSSNTTMSNVKFSIQMPKAFDENNFSILYTKNDSNNFSGFSHYIDKNTNTIYGELNKGATLGPNDGVAVRITLPEGYFKKLFTVPILAIISILLGILTILLSYLLWRKYGKEKFVVNTLQSNIQENRKKPTIKNFDFQGLAFCFLSFMTIFTATYKPILDYAYNVYMTFFFVTTGSIAIVVAFTLFYRVKNILIKAISIIITLLCGGYSILIITFGPFTSSPIYVIALAFSIVVSGVSSYYSAQIRYKWFLVTDTPQTR